MTNESAMVRSQETSMVSSGGSLVWRKKNRIENNINIVLSYSSFFLVAKYEISFNQEQQYN